MLDKFNSWTQEILPALISSGMKVEVIVCQPTSNPAIRLDIETKQHAFATIGFWSTGDYALEAIDFDGNAIYMHLGHVQSETSLDDEFRDFFKSLET
ncbi:MAG: hypothetical protein WAN35_04635 [Terracidiphilus sp.]